MSKWDYPDICHVCGGALSWSHDHKPDLSGLDDGPPLRAARKPGRKYTEAEARGIRARAWATRRHKYGQKGHA